MFGRKKTAEAHAKGVALLRDFVNHQLETENMKEAARSADMTVAVLQPQIPITMDFSAGWFGGNPALPESFAWPEQGGQKMLFVGQINLAALPREMWGGLGPRKGWTALFLPGAGDFTPIVRHFDGPLVEVKAPPPNSAVWARNHNFKEPQTFALPRWPIRIETMPGKNFGSSSGVKPTQAAQQPSLLDPAYQPFDRATLLMLIDSMGEAVLKMAKQLVRFPTMKCLSPDDTEWFERRGEQALATFKRFFAIEGRVRTSREVGTHEIKAVIDELAELEASDYRNLSDGNGGYCEVERHEGRLIDPSPVGFSSLQWWSIYDVYLRNHALTAYTTDPDRLPGEIRARLENEWRTKSSCGLGAMGHAPRGHIYTPHGPDTDNEVLLELHTSPLTGWIWADCYSLVLLIEREALRRGDFSAVTFDITN